MKLDYDQVSFSRIGRKGGPPILYQWRLLKGGSPVLSSKEALDPNDALEDFKQELASHDLAASIVDLLVRDILATNPTYQAPETTPGGGCDSSTT